MVQRKTLINDGIWVASTQCLSALGHLIGIRLLTEIMPPSVFGYFYLLLGVSALISSGLANPTMQALLKYYPEYVAKNQGDMVYNVASRQLIKLLLWSSPVVITLSIISIYLDWMDIVTLVLLFALVVVEILRLQNMAMLNAVRAQRAYGVWLCAEAWGRPIMAWIAINAFGADIHIVLLSYIFISLIIFCIMRFIAPHTSMREKIGENAELSKTFWKYTLPLLPLGLLGWVSSMADRYIIGSLLTSADVGLYVAIYGLASRPMLMLGSIVETTIRPVYQQALVANDKLNAIKYLHKWGVILIIGSSIALITSIIWHQEIANIFIGQHYRKVSYLFPWIVGGYALLSFSDIPLRACYANGATVNILLVLVADSILAVILGYIFVNHYGLFGAAVAVPVYYGIRFAFATYRSRKILIYRG